VQTADSYQSRWWFDLAQIQVRGDKPLDILILIVCIAICEGAGVIGSFFTTGKIPTWYATLKKPALRPPNWLFAPVWTVLYLLMGIAAYLVWQEGLDKPDVQTALVIFGIQLLLNVLWSVVFFGMESPSGGLVVIAALWVEILFSIIRFVPLSLAAGLLLLPYIAWVTVAAALNLSIYRLNRR
jgi:translocator protein